MQIKFLLLTQLNKLLISIKVLMSLITFFRTFLNSFFKNINKKLNIKVDGYCRGPSTREG